MTKPRQVGGLDTGDPPIKVTCPYCGKAYKTRRPPSFCLGEGVLPPEVLEEAAHLTCPHCQTRTYWEGEVVP